MDSQQWQIIKSLFEQVCDLSESERLPRLTQLSDDKNIIDEVLNLFLSERQSQSSTRDGFYTNVRSGAHDLLFKQTKFTSGDIIGVYQIERLIDEGGMGSVYLANRVDENFEQKVAIKVIRQSLYNAEKTNRFMLETKVLGQLVHPYIARIFDAGNTADFCPFIIMEYVNGENIFDYCDRHQLDISARLKLFILVCEAIQFAHQKGIIHRDIKPGNILVTEINGNAIPKIIDFGIALTQPMGETPTPTDTSENSGNPLLQNFNSQKPQFGTPLYMSPEQIINAESVDTRSDVYALGVLLFQLLSGSAPFKNESFDIDTLLKIKNRAILKLKNSFLLTEKRSDIAACRDTTADLLIKKLDDELDAITQKSLNSKIENRYASAIELRNDIERYLLNFPVTAMPVTKTYWLKKLVLRYQLQFITGSLIITGLIVAVFVTNVALLKEQQARKIAQLESQKATAVSQYLAEIFAAIDPRKLGKEVRVIDLLEKSEEDIKERFSAQPLVKASLLTTFGKSRTGLGDYDVALDLLSQALAINERYLGFYHENTINTANLIGELYFIKKEYEIALEISELNLARARKSLSDQHRLTMNLINNVATGNYQIGLDEKDDRKQSKALEMMEELYQLNIEVLGMEHQDTCFVRNNLAAWYGGSKFYNKSIELYLQNHKILSSIFGEKNFYSLSTLTNLAIQYKKTNQLKKAKYYAQKSYAGLKEIQDKEHVETLFAAVQLLNILLRHKNFKEAEALVVEISAEIRANKTDRSIFDETTYAFVQKVLGMAESEDMQKMITHQSY